MPDPQKLNIVDEVGNIIGEDTRENIHTRGLLHREVHVWFSTPRGEIIFQHRGVHKDTNPNLLDATVGGHVEIGDSFERAAVREVAEDTGIQVKSTNLHLVSTVRAKTHDPITNTTNNVLRAVYAFRYDGPVKQLQVEVGVGQGFETWTVEKLLRLSDKERRRFVPSIFTKERLEILRSIERLAKNNA